MQIIWKDRTESLHAIVSSIGDAMIACDLNGKIIFYNPASIELLGPDLSEVPVQNLPSNFGVFLLDKVTLFPVEKLPLLLGLQGAETNDVEHFIRNKAKPTGVFVSVTGRPIRGPSGEILGSVIAVRDISNRKKAEEEIRVANSALYDKNQELLAVNKELESFSYAISHDLRTPLRGISGFSDILLRNFSAHLNAEGLDYLTRIKKSAAQLGEQIDGLLELSRLTRGKLSMGKINLSEIARYVADGFKTAEPERKVRFEIADGLVANCDPRLLQCVLQNLIGNSWKFSSKTPEAVITFGMMPSEAEKTTYFVKDNGAGFNEKYSSKLFQIFQRLHSFREFEGNGIGLATVLRVIRRHGGTIRAEGKLNEGATFYFTLNEEVI